LITFLNGEEPSQMTADVDAAWSELAQLVQDCQMDTGIADLAHQHDHYLHGKAKRQD
jgi:hypothetical protein